MNQETISQLYFPRLDAIVAEMKKYPLNFCNIVVTDTTVSYNGKFIFSPVSAYVSQNDDGTMSWVLKSPSESVFNKSFPRYENLSFPKIWLSVFSGDTNFPENYYEHELKTAIEISGVQYEGFKVFSLVSGKSLTFTPEVSMYRNFLQKWSIKEEGKLWPITINSHQTVITDIFKMQVSIIDALSKTTEPLKSK